MAIKAPQSNDTELNELMNDVKAGKIQLPEFQRSWTWDDNRLRGILASISQGYPFGAIMRLQYGNEDIKFKYRPIEGVKLIDVVPEFLILDGQQRLTGGNLRTEDDQCSLFLCDTSCIASNKKQCSL